MISQSKFGIYLSFLAAVYVAMPVKSISPIDVKIVPKVQKPLLPEPPPHPQDYLKRKYKVLEYFSPGVMAIIDCDHPVNMRNFEVYAALQSYRT